MFWLKPPPLNFEDPPPPIAGGGEGAQPPHVHNTHGKPQEIMLIDPIGLIDYKSVCIIYDKTILDITFNTPLNPICTCAINIKYSKYFFLHSHNYN